MPALSRHLDQNPARDLETRIFDGVLINAARHAKREPPPGLVEHHEAALSMHCGDDLIHDAAQHLVQIHGRVEGLRQANQQRQALGRGATKFSIGHGAFRGDASSALWYHRSGLRTTG
jgi:hypothetical protein